jgi:hypothetical protein
MSRPRKTARTKDATSDLDPDGDLTLTVKAAEDSKSYLVSSKILSIASPVFRSMMGPNFKEGHALPTAARPENTLKDDDRLAMDYILRIVHHRSSEVPERLEPWILASIAVHCDKYDLIEVVKPFLKNWCHAQTLRDTEEDLAFMIMANRLTNHHRWTQWSPVPSDCSSPDLKRD